MDDKILLKTEELMKNELKERYEEVSRIYLFTTEDIKKVVSNFDLKDKKILTVLASSDQTLNFILKKPKSIETFDINVLTKYYFDLKQIAIKYLSYEEFLSFFLLADESFSKKIYDRIEKYLEEDSKKFWNYVFALNDELRKLDKKSLYRSGLFHFLGYQYDPIDVNEYLEKENYNRLKKILFEYEIPFYRMDLYNSDFSKLGIYDFIYLSNIANYMPESKKTFLFKKDNLKYFRTLIKEELGNHLEKDGTIVASYLYECWGKEGLGDVTTRQKIFTEAKGFKEIAIESSEYKDKILVYKK